MVWARKTDAIGIDTGVAVKENLLDDFETAYGANLIGCTVIRIRGLVAATLSADETAPQLARLAIRVGSSTEGNTEGGDPYLAPHLDWMAWEPFLPSVRGNVVGSTNLSSFGAPASQRLIDVRSSRKLGELNEELQLWLHTIGTQAVFFSYDLSVLLKLP